MKQRYGMIENKTCVTWNFSLNVQLENSCMSAGNEWDNYRLKHDYLNTTGLHLQEKFISSVEWEWWMHFFHQPERVSWEASDTTAAYWQYPTHVKTIVNLQMSSYGYSKGCNSLLNTTVYTNLYWFTHFMTPLESH